MDDFQKNLAQQLAQGPQPEKFVNEIRKPETVTLDRLINFYSFVENNGWSCSICFYRGKMSAWINTHGNGILEGIGDTINDALDDLLKNFS